MTVGLVHSRTMRKSVTHTGHTSSGHDSPRGCTKSIHEHPQHWGQLLSQHTADPPHTTSTHGIAGWARRCWSFPCHPACSKQGTPVTVLTYGGDQAWAPRPPPPPAAASCTALPAAHRARESQGETGAQKTCTTPVCNPTSHRSQVRVSRQGPADSRVQLCQPAHPCRQGPVAHSAGQPLAMATQTLAMATQLCPG